MKKVFIAVFVLAAGLVNAQEMASKSTSTKSNDLHFGLRGGVNLANIIRDDNTNASSEMKVGFNAGAFLEIPIVNGFSIQPEVQYSQKGYKASGTFLGSPYVYKANTDYVDVPVLAKFSPSKSFGIVVGPQLSFLTSTTYKFTTNNTAYENVVNNNNNDLEKNILGGVVGLEVGASNVIFSARYSLDFKKNEGDGTSSTPKYKNQVVGLSLGFRF
jgi:Outer membrane protein beta-barrel domain